MATVSDSYVQKIAESFDLFDGDHDGVMTTGDSTRGSEELLRQLGRDIDSPQVRNYYQFKTQLWRDLDKDNDGRVTKDEYIAFHIDRSPEQLNEIIDRYSDVIFELADSDGNNELSKEEFAHVQRARGETSSAFVDDVFGRFDTDGDGVLTKSEFREYARDFLGYE